MSNHGFDDGEDPKGAAVTRTYDTAGRLAQITNQVNNAYRRFVYWPDGWQVLSYETLNDGVGAAYEAYSNTVVDGAGRVRALAAENPGSTGGYVGSLATYDVMGRLVQQTKPTEMHGSWQPAGDDSGWVNTVQTYDWKGRPLLTTNPDGSTTESLRFAPSWPSQLGRVNGVVVNQTSHRLVPRQASNLDLKVRYSLRCLRLII